MHRSTQQRQAALHSGTPLVRDESGKPLWICAKLGKPPDVDELTNKSGKPLERAGHSPQALSWTERKVVRFPKFAQLGTPPDFGEGLRILRRFTHIRSLTIGGTTPALDPYGVRRKLEMFRT